MAELLDPAVTVLPGMISGRFDVAVRDVTVSISFEFCSAVEQVLGGRRADLKRKLFVVSSMLSCCSCSWVEEDAALKGAAYFCFYCMVACRPEPSAAALRLITIILFDAAVALVLLSSLAGGILPPFLRWFYPDTAVASSSKIESLMRRSCTTASFKASFLTSCAAFTFISCYFLLFYYY